MRYIALPTSVEFSQDEYGHLPAAPNDGNPWMVWDYGIGECHKTFGTEAEAAAAAAFLSSIDEEEWKEKESK